MQSDNTPPRLYLDKRESTRHQSLLQGISVEHAQVGRLLVEVINLSRGGLLLRLPASLPCGEEVLIYPPAHTGLRPTPARIVRQRFVEGQEQSFIECAVRFTDPAELRRRTWFITLKGQKAA